MFYSGTVFVSMPDVPDPPWWRRRPEAARDKKPLTRDAIVEAALVLLERDGLQGLSMRRLAQELGAGAASLYWHVGDKEELLSLLLDRIVGEAEVPDPDPEHWQATVKELGRAARRHLSQRRDAAALSLGRVPAGPNSLPILERNLAVLAASALPPKVIAYAADMFALYVGAFAVRGEHPDRRARRAGRLLRLAAARGLPDAHAAGGRPDRGWRGRALRVRARIARPRPGGDGLR